MNWEKLAVFHLNGNWQLTPIANDALFRIRSTNFSSFYCQLKQVQTIDQKEFWDYKRLFIRPDFTIFIVSPPSFFTQRKLAFRADKLPTGLTTYPIEIEYSAMPISNPATISSPVATTATSTTVAAATTSTAIIAADGNRKGLTIFNNSTARLYLDHDAAVTTSDFTVLLEAGGFYEVPSQYAQLQMSGIWAAANGNALVRAFT